MNQIHLEGSPQLARLVCPTMASVEAVSGAHPAWTRKDMIDFSREFSAQIGPSYARFGGDRSDKLILTIRLPEHYGVCVRFLSTLKGESQITNNGNLVRSLLSMHDRLRVHMGLPPPGYVAPAQELAFLSAIYAEPGDLASWMAYGDWLADRGDPRGERIVENFDGKRRVFKRWRRK